METDKEFLDSLRSVMAEMKATVEQMVDAKIKGLPIADLQEKVAKYEGAVAEMIDKKTFENEVRALKERLSRSPVALGAGGPGEALSFGQQFIDSDAYKGTAGVRRVKAQVTLKGRIVPERKQVPANPFIGTATSGFVWFPKRIGLFTEPTFPLIMRELVDTFPLSEGNAIEYVKETWDLNADYQVAEGDRKAQSDVTYTDMTAMVRTLAHFVKISRQMLADAPFIRAAIDNKMVYGLAMKEDYEILWGDGAAGHLLGIMPQAPAVTAGWLPGAQTQIDEIYAAMTEIMAKGYAPSAVVMNPMSWASMSMIRDTSGLYILGGPPMAEPVPRIWGLPVALTTNMPVPQYLVGAFPGNAALFDRETPTVDIAYENEDDFIRNLVTIRAEERIALAVYVPQAFVKGSLTALPPFRAGGTGEQLPAGGNQQLSGGTQGTPVSTSTSKGVKQPQS